MIGINYWWLKKLTILSYLPSRLFTLFRSLTRSHFIIIISLYCPFVLSCTGYNDRNSSGYVRVGVVVFAVVVVLVVIVIVFVVVQLMVNFTRIHPYRECGHFSMKTIVVVVKPMCVCTIHCAVVHKIIRNRSFNQPIFQLDFIVTEYEHNFILVVSVVLSLSSICSINQNFIFNQMCTANV